MTETAKRKGVEIGAGALIYIIAWTVTELLEIPGSIQWILFISAYIVLAFSTIWAQIKKIAGRRFIDENLLMLIATVGAFAVERRKEAVAAMLFYQIGKFVEELSLSRTKKSIAEYIDIRPEYANLKIGKEEKIIPPQELAEGQIIILRPGEKVPVDCVVTDGTGTVDLKALTGESRLKTVERGDKLYSGSINMSGVLEAEVIHLYHESTAEKIMDLIERSDDRKSASIHFADRFNSYYTPVVILIALFTILLPPMIFDSPRAEWIYRGMIVLVAACPCGLMVSIPMAFLGGIGAASKQGVLVKGSAFIEALTEVDTFVFDKTGTLTEGVFHVRDIVPVHMDAQELLEIATLTESGSNHPIAMSLQEAFGKKPDRSRVEEVEEYPGFGVCARVDGRKICMGNARMMMRHGVDFELTDKPGTLIYVAVDGRYAGYILIADVIRKDVYQLFHWLHKKNYGTVMFTGDNEQTAEEVASKLKIESVYAELMPENKVDLLQEFLDNQIENEKLAFVGDGINDAPALSSADIGIGMGGLGADAALEAADIILLEDEPSKIISAIKIARATLRSIRQNIVFAIGMKILVVVLAVFGFVTMQNAIIADMIVMLINILNSFWMLRYPGYGV